MINIFDNVICDKIVKDIYEKVKDKVISGKYTKQTSQWSVLSNLELRDGTEYIFEYHGVSFKTREVIHMQGDVLLEKYLYNADGNLLNNEEDEKILTLESEQILEKYKDIGIELSFSTNTNKFSVFAKDVVRIGSTMHLPCSSFYNNPNNAIKDFHNKYNGSVFIKV